MSEFAFSSTVSKCPTCGGDAMARSDFFEAVPENGCEVMQKLHLIEREVRKYHLALDSRKHGGVASAELVSAVETILEMPWTQGAATEWLAANPRVAHLYVAKTGKQGGVNLG